MPFLIKFDTWVDELEVSSLYLNEAYNLLVAELVWWKYYFFIIWNHFVNTVDTNTFLLPSIVSGADTEFLLDFFHEKICLSKHIQVSNIYCYLFFNILHISFLGIT